MLFLNYFSWFGLQPVFSASILSEIMKPDGSSAISVVNDESLSAELAYELMNIQVTGKSDYFYLLFALISNKTKSLTEVLTICINIHSINDLQQVFLS